ncbi:hypothetical protein J3U88_24805 [Acanthopleuribacter pedis]|uniref:Uncharacterized protein n=1 Tax=Acanthopleuribacter pedis TaxID=442870 RepID=A0A8J7U4Q8_9BACT|nr:hypothetical protein [Acanthopleuribacter pedis]
MASNQKRGGKAEGAMVGGAGLKGKTSETKDNERPCATGCGLPNLCCSPWMGREHSQNTNLQKVCKAQNFKKHSTKKISLRNMATQIVQNQSIRKTRQIPDKVEFCFSVNSMYLTAG